jgi:hypothetical protein
MNDLQISYAIVLFARKLFPLAGAAVACGFASAPHTRSAARSIMYQDFRSLRSLELVDDHAFCATTSVGQGVSSLADRSVHAVQRTAEKHPLYPVHIAKTNSGVLLT